MPVFHLIRVLLAPVYAFCYDEVVNVITKTGLLHLVKRHPAAREAVLSWYGAAKRAAWGGFHQVRADFPTVDQVGEVLIFNIAGGYRLIVRISYRSQRLYIKALLNHGEYDRKEWMKWTH